MATHDDSSLIEVTLTCGDTVSTRVQPPLGAYRYCIHCEGKRRVVAIELHAQLRHRFHYLYPLTAGESLELMAQLVKGHKRLCDYCIWLYQNGNAAETYSDLADELMQLVSDAGDYNADAIELGALL